jgi:AraC-like DNA-binding protein
MNVEILKETINNYVVKNDLTINSFLKKNGFTSSSNFSRMLSQGAFKFDFIEKIADILEISIDELVGRKTVVKSSGSNYLADHTIDIIPENEYKELSRQKDIIIADKIKIISLLENQLEYERSKR